MNTEMKVAGLTIDPDSNMPVVILKDIQEDNAVSISIGLIEALAIAMELEHIRFSRPMTHDLLCAVIRTLGAELRGVEVSDLKDNTFFASLILCQNGKQSRIDARPSDAIAVALRLGCPIFVSKHVLEQCSELSGMTGTLEDIERRLEEARLTELLESLPRREFGKYMM